MKTQKNAKKPTQERKKKTLMDWFFSREKPDKEYKTELKSQWDQMDRAQRIRFVFGAMFGLVLFIAALVLVYFILAAMVGWLGMR